MAEKIVAKEPIAAAAAKRVPDRGWGKEIGQGLEMESRVLNSLFGTHNQKEGAHAFLERGSPQSKGE